MGILNDPNINTAQQQYETAANQAATYQSASALLPAKLKEAIQSKLDYNKDLIEQKNKAMSEYFMAPSKARETYAGIWNPFQREALVAKERAMAYQPYANLQDIQTQRMGSIADIISAGTGAFNAATSASQSAAQIARQKYEDLVGNAKWEYEQTHKGGSSSDDALKFTQWMAGQYKPTAGQEQAANNATSGLASIQKIKEVIAKNPNALRNAKLGILGIWDPEARVVNKELKNVTDILTRARTGAALNADEQKFYNSYIANPLEAILGYQEGTNTSLDNMESIFTRQINDAKNPYMDILNNYYQQQYGVSTQGTSGSTGGVTETKVVMKAPDGKLYKVDQSEVMEAKKNGWVQQ